MKRWAWHIFCAISLLVFVSSVTIWVRGYFWQELLYHVTVRPDTTGRGGPPVVSRCGFISNRGAAGIMWGKYSKYAGLAPSSLMPGWRYYVLAPVSSYKPTSSPGLSFQFAGFYYSHHEDVVDTANWLMLPLWLFLPAAVPPLLWWRKWRKGSGGRGFPVAVTSGQKKENLTTEFTENTETQRGD